MKNKKMRNEAKNPSFRGYQRRGSRKDIHEKRGMYEETQFKENLKRIKINHWGWDNEPENVFWIKLVLDDPVKPKDFKPKLVACLEGFLDGDI